MASLFSACKSAVRNNNGGTFNIGGYDIDLELYRQSDINTDVQYGNVAFGDNDESKIVVIADDTITVPEGYILTPDHPKKSLVLFCNNLINNGTISMYQKAPNVLPHDFFILDSNIAGTVRDIVIPAYADNAVSGNTQDASHLSGLDGNNGTNRNCGSGGQGSYENKGTQYSGLPFPASGSGYAFGGGAGSAGGTVNVYKIAPDVDSEYPMRGGVPNNAEGWNNYAWRAGGVGTPVTANVCPWGPNRKNNFGCGGRIIIFCKNFTNNGNITVNGTDTKMLYDLNSGYQSNLDINGCSFGGASGAGAVDLFYTNMITQGTITAIGGQLEQNYNTHPGKGGNGSITLSQWSQTKLFKTEVKYFSQANVAYLLTQLSDRIKDSRMGE